MAVFRENGVTWNKQVDLCRHSEEKLLILNLENREEIWALHTLKSAAGKER